MSTRFVFVTDSHYYPDALKDFGAPKMLTRGRPVIEAVVPAVNALQPDFIVHGGDLLCCGSSFELPRETFLRSIGEVAELGFPDDEHLRIRKRVSVLERNAGTFRQWAVVDADLRLFRFDVVQCAVGFTSLLVEQDAVPVAESASLHVLASHSHCMTFNE